MSRRKTIREHYEQTLSQREENYDIVDWADEPSQRRRFEVLADNVPLAGRSILDVGCGLGDLWAFLKDREVAVRYTGVDIVPKMIAAARDRHPEATFVFADVFDQDPFGPGSFDVVFVSGAFNLELGNNMQFLARALARLLTIARGQLVFNLLHHRAERKYDYCAYYDPEKVLALVAEAGRDVRLIDDYLPNDFTLIVTK